MRGCSVWLCIQSNLGEWCVGWPERYTESGNAGFSDWVRFVFSTAQFALAAQAPRSISAKATTVYPHIHLRARRIKAELIDWQGSVTPLIYDNNWEFNCQEASTDTLPVSIPARGSVKVTCAFR